MAQFIAGFTKLDGCLFQHIEDTGKFAVHACQFGDQVPGGVQLALQIDVFAIREDSQRLLAGGEQLPAVSQTLVLFINLLKLARLRVEFVQFF